MNTVILGDLLMTLHKNMKTKVERELKTYGIGMGQLQILMVFFTTQSEVLTQSELVKALAVDKGNVSRSLVKLLEKGYIALAEEQKRGYKLSEEGVALRSQIMKVFLSINGLMIEGINENELNHMVHTLTQVAKNLEASI